MTSQSILHRIAINRTGQPLKQFAIKRRDENNVLDGANIAKALNEQLESTDKNNLDTVPRKTVLALVSIALDTKYTFKVAKGDGENYIGAMRQVLSRTRKKAKRRKMLLDEFKMLQVGEIVKHDEYDEITLMRSKTLSVQEESVYDELFNALKKA